MNHNCALLSSLCKGKKRQRYFTYNVLYELQELKQHVADYLFGSNRHGLRRLPRWNSVCERFWLDWGTY